MQTLSLSPIILLIITTRGSDGDCKVGETTYKVGDEWKDESKCVGHICLEDGTYDTKQCEPSPVPLPEHWILNPGNPEELFPLCCDQAIPPMYDYSLPGCEVGNETIKVGQQVNDPSSCYLKVCKGNGNWAIASCGISSQPAGWDLVPDDPTKPFPECCGHAIPPHSLVPDVVDHVEFGDFLNVTYKGNLKVSEGNELTPTQVKEQPEVTYTAHKKSHYLLVMTDPDAPSRQNPELREFLHWLVGNIPGNNISSGEVLTQYIGSGPPQGSGLHRYVFLLYKQPGKLTFDEPRVNNTSTKNRPKFSSRKFSEKYTLGNPIGFNLYQAQYDDYVPQIHKQLGFI